MLCWLNLLWFLDLCNLREMDEERCKILPDLLIMNMKWKQSQWNPLQHYFEGLLCNIHYTSMFFSYQTLLLLSMLAIPFEIKLFVLDQIRNRLKGGNLRLHQGLITTHRRYVNVGMCNFNVLLNLFGNQRLWILVLFEWLNLSHSIDGDKFKGSWSKKLFQAPPCILWQCNLTSPKPEHIQGDGHLGKTQILLKVQVEDDDPFL
jgi:hypothetical protein